MLFNKTPFAELAVFDKTATIAIYLTLFLALAMLVIAVIVKRKKPDAVAQFQSTAIGLGVGYSIGISALLLFLKLDEYQGLGWIDKPTFVPIAVLLSVAILMALGGLLVSIFAKEKFKLYSKVSYVAIALALIIVLIIRFIEYYKTAEVKVSSEVQLYVYSAFLIALIAVIALAFGEKKNFNNTKSIVYASVCIAMSFALSYLRLFELPQGGSITIASLLPIMVYSYMFGIRKGVVVGVIYGFLQFVQAPWFYHPIQFLLDYPIAFGAIGLAGVFKEKQWLSKKPSLQFLFGAIVVAVIRYLSHVVSGIFVFGSGDPENYSAVAWSFLYNAFVFADMAITIIAGSGAFSNKSFLRLLSEKGQQENTSEN